MSFNWLDDISGGSIDETASEEFYCPYTNSAKCALLTKGWQPQELCLALECEQMQMLKHSRNQRRRDRAA